MTSFRSTTSPVSPAPPHHSHVSGWRWQCELLGSPRPRGMSLWPRRVMLHQPHINTVQRGGFGTRVHGMQQDPAPEHPPPRPNHHPTLLTPFPSLPSSLAADEICEEVSDGLPGGRHPVPHQTLRGLTQLMETPRDAPTLYQPRWAERTPAPPFPNPGGTLFPLRVTS